MKPDIHKDLKIQGCLTNSNIRKSNPHTNKQTEREREREGTPEDEAEAEESESAGVLMDSDFDELRWSEFQSESEDLLLDFGEELRETVQGDRSGAVCHWEHGTLYGTGLSINESDFGWEKPMFGATSTLNIKIIFFFFQLYSILIYYKPLL